MKSFTRTNMTNRRNEFAVFWRLQAESRFMLTCMGAADMQTARVFSWTRMLRWMKMGAGSAGNASTSILMTQASLHL